MHNKNIDKNNNLEKGFDKVKEKVKKKGRGAIANEIKEKEILDIRNLKTSFRKGCKNYFIKDNKLYYKRAIKIKNQKMGGVL